MSEFNWCHGPNCHTRVTTDRVRGPKGNKVLRTRKINLSNQHIRNSVWSVFCSQGCWNEFAYAHWDEFIRLHPRTEALETSIEIKKETHESPYWGKRVVTQIKPIDNNPNP